MQTAVRRMPTFLYAALFLAAACFGAQLFAQSSASVSGQVLDAGGAAVSGASVTLLRPSSGVKVVTTTDSRGNYILPPVVPGTYSLRVTAKKFAPWSESGILLEIGANKVVNATLQVGAVSQSVQVTGAPPELNTQDVDSSTVTEPSLVANIPLDVRNPLQEVNFTVGVTRSNSLTAGTNMSSQSTTNQFYINGSKEGESEITIDGATDSVVYDMHAAGAIPGVDALDEFRIITEAYEPQYGHTAGGIESFEIKSGTNQFHGGAWEYFRNSALDANGYNANHAGLAKPSFTRNQFGAQIGGPVDIPHVYNGHNKTFFFGSFEELRDNFPGISGSATAGYTTTVPTALEKTGDFSQSTEWTIFDPSTTQYVAAGGTYTCPDGLIWPRVGANNAPYVYGSPTTGNPATLQQTTVATAGYYRCPAYYAGHGTNNHGGYNVLDPNNLPSQQFNPIAQKLLAAYPAPNQTGPVPGSDENNFFSDAATADDDLNFDIRVDHHFSDTQSIFGHVSYFNNHINYAPVFGQSSLTPTFSDNFIPGRNYMVDHTWAISPHLIFNQHLSYAYFQSHRGSPNPLGTGAFDIPSAAAPGVTATFSPQVEAVTNQLGEIGNSEPFERNPNSVWQYLASFSWLKGRHTFKFGADLRRYDDQLWDPQLLEITPASSGGLFSGGPVASAQQSNTGNAIADLLTGQATVTSGYAPKVNFRHDYFAFYGQDTARLTSKLTVTYGLRYSYEGADVSNGNELSYIDTTDPSPIANQVAANPYFDASNLVGGVGIVGLNGSSRDLQIPQKNHFAPRVGVAYALNQKTVFHAGFGIFWHPKAQYYPDPAAFGFTRASTSIDAGTDGYTPLFNLSDPFPNGLPEPYGNNPSPLPGNNTGSGPLSIELGQSIYGNLHQQSNAYQESWSFDVQRQLPGNFVVTAAYVGNEGVHLLEEMELNQLTDAELAEGSALTAKVANPFYNVITDGSSVLSKSTVQTAYLLHAFPQFTAVAAENVGMGHSSYESGQLTIEHRMSNGLSMMLGYTRSKSIDDSAEYGASATIQDNGCLRCERSISDLDQTNVLRLSTLYELPFGPQKPFVNQGPLSHIGGGWQIAGTYQYNTGQPLQLKSPVRLGSALLGSSVMRPTLVPGENITTKVVNPQTGELSTFNPAAFTETGEFAFGNAPRYLSDVRYPSFSELDVALQKQTKITERMSATFRIEALNALNTVVFGGADNTVTDSNFGFNPETQANNPREAQLSARFTF